MHTLTPWRIHHGSSNTRLWGSGHSDSLNEQSADNKPAPQQSSGQSHELNGVQSVVGDLADADRTEQGGPEGKPHQLRTIGAALRLWQPAVHSCEALLAQTGAASIACSLGWQLHQLAGGSAVACAAVLGAVRACPALAALAGVSNTLPVWEGAIHRAGHGVQMVRAGFLFAGTDQRVINELRPDRNTNGHLQAERTSTSAPQRRNLSSMCSSGAVYGARQQAQDVARQECSVGAA